jgi:predicted HAD superfamily Cof-like phosphohydrolase
MQEPSPLNNVAEFHTTFKHPIEKEPRIPAENRCQLRVALLAEELKELEAAIQDKDIVEVADALCDLQYVLSGAILEFGLGEKFKGLFDEVQRSNMSKSCKTREEAEATVKYYQEEKDTDCFYEESDGHFLVYRTADNKTLKSINYSPADLKKILGSPKTEVGSPK